MLQLPFFFDFFPHLAPIKFRQTLDDVDHGIFGALTIQSQISTSGLISSDDRIGVGKGTVFSILWGNNNLNHTSV